MLTRYEQRGLVWIDLESPTHDEIESISREFNLHPAIASEALNPSSRQKVDIFGEAMFFVLHLPATEHQESAGELQEIDFIIGKQFLVTVHYETITTLFEIGKRFEINTILDKSAGNNHAGFLFYHIVRSCYESLGRQLEFIASDLQVAEKRIFRGGEKTMVEVLSQINRRILDFRTALRSQREIWNSFEHASLDFFGPKFTFYASAITGSYHKLLNQLESDHELLSELRATNDSLLTSKTNETMVHLTMMAFVTFPLTLIAGIFSMSTENTPIRGMHNDFWIVLGVMACTAIILFGYFKFKKWL